MLRQRFGESGTAFHGYRSFLQGFLDYGVGGLPRQGLQGTDQRQTGIQQDSHLAGQNGQVLLLDDRRAETDIQVDVDAATAAAFLFVFGGVFGGCFSFGCGRGSFGGSFVGELDRGGEKSLILQEIGNFLFGRRIFFTFLLFAVGIDRSLHVEGHNLHSFPVFMYISELLPWWSRH